MGNGAEESPLRKISVAMHMWCLTAAVKAFKFTCQAQPVYLWCCKPVSSARHAPENIGIVLLLKLGLQFYREPTFAPHRPCFLRSLAEEGLIFFGKALAGLQIRELFLDLFDWHGLLLSSFGSSETVRLLSRRQYWQACLPRTCALMDMPSSQSPCMSVCVRVCVYCHAPEPGTGEPYEMHLRRAVGL
mmetsp:Transcript_27343/g.73949  ORF Transcript_27343/g.73949 Transcript_27343/m.73949 type:complete len:188 (-) Transcript_27343:8-571(-)|eukprot:900685-Pelagomonas_calceolata.AAC.2